MASLVTLECEVDNFASQSTTISHKLQFLKLRQQVGAPLCFHFKLLSRQRARPFLHGLSIRSNTVTCFTRA